MICFTVFSVKFNEPSPPSKRNRKGLKIAKIKYCSKKVYVHYSLAWVKEQVKTLQKDSKQDSYFNSDLLLPPNPKRSKLEAYSVVIRVSLTLSMHTLF